MNRNEHQLENAVKILMRSIFIVYRCDSLTEIAEKERKTNREIK